ncbi:hypothetical protein GJAV_G00005440 [Gymnothorax javanicus]|nr:hypothetical protein GJAV_G00005440 [Gymnothorax javanicus]
MIPNMTDRGHCPPIGGIIVVITPDWRTTLPRGLSATGLQAGPTWWLVWFLSFYPLATYGRRGIVIMMASVRLCLSHVLRRPAHGNHL